jgi:hypothetical protein
MLRAEITTATRNLAKCALALYIVRLIHIGLKREKTEAVGLTSTCFGKHVLCFFLHFFRSQFIAYISLIQVVPLATEPDISLVILTPMKILQRGEDNIKMDLQEVGGGGGE